MEFELEAIKLNCLHLITMMISKCEHPFLQTISDELVYESSVSELYFILHVTRCSNVRK